jgi:hypothetical protein
MAEMKKFLDTLIDEIEKDKKQVDWDWVKFIILNIMFKDPCLNL